MPKEFIRNRWAGQTARSHQDCDHKTSDSEAACPGTEVPLDDAAIKIGWSKDHGHVELAIVWDEDGGPDSPGSEFNARHIQLDREGLQQLIRWARKARDDAFGADE